MSGLELSPAAQNWVIVLLVWIGFSTLASVAARILIPLSRPSGLVGTLAIGIVGSAAGLLVFSMFSKLPVNPISPAGFGVATAGTLVVLIAYQIVSFVADRRAAAAAAAEEEGVPTEDLDAA